MTAEECDLTFERLEQVMNDAGLAWVTTQVAASQALSGPHFADGVDQGLRLVKLDVFRANQAPRRSSYWRTRLARVLILRTLRQANHRDPDKNASFFSPAKMAG